MPRGIPNAKRDDTGMRYTTFHVPLASNPKHMGSSYLKSENQTLWARKAAQQRRHPQTDGPPDTRRGQRVLVIHPGSRALRIGRASDVTPVTVPNVVARRTAPPVPLPTFVEGIARPRNARGHPQVDDTSGVHENGDEYAVNMNSDDPFDQKVAAITISLRDRMRFYKLPVANDAPRICSEFNESSKPEAIPEANDPYRVLWITDSGTDVLVGENALRIANPEEQGYVVRWPIYGPGFNTRDYPSVQTILSDIETVLRVTLADKLKIAPREYKEYSVVLVIPDFYERAYVQEWLNLLFVTMGFAQLCVQQESLAATYGAGISNACVVDMGAATTSIACVDEGTVISDTRMTLNMGGNDITEFLFVLLNRVSFPYRDMDLARWYNWGVMEDLKARICTLAEGDVALNLYDFVVRKPRTPTEKYALRAYDEIILAPMCIFEPRVVEFDRKRVGMRSTTHPDVSTEPLEHLVETVSQAMVISTQHLIPQVSRRPPTPPPPQLVPAPTASASEASEEQKRTPSQPPTGTGAANSKEGTPKKDEPAEGEAPEAKENGATPVPATGDSAAPSQTDTPMEGVIDVDAMKTPPPAPPPQPPQPLSHAATPPLFPGGFGIDVAFEASKLPLDVAIFNSARAAGGDDKIRKYLQAVLVVGGTAFVPGIAFALESRLQAIATPLVPNMEKVTIIPPPKDVDPRAVCWKGAAVLARMEGVADLWIGRDDWDILGMRGLKERCYYL